MTKKERLMAVLTGNVPDRPPVGFWFHFNGDQAVGEKCVQAHVDYYKQTDIDFLKIMSDELLYPFQIDIDCADDWQRIEPLPHNHSFFLDSVTRCAHINELIGNECYTFYNFFSPFTLLRACSTFTPNALHGRTADDTVMKHLKENEKAVRHALAVIAGDMAYLAEQVLTVGGCLGIYQSVQGAEHGRMTAEEYTRIIKPSDIMVLDACHAVSPYNILHMCSWAGFPNHLEYWKDYPCIIKNWGIGIEGLTLSQAKSFFAHDNIFLGGMDNRRNHPLFAGDKAAVYNAVAAVLREMEGKPFILGADCTVPSDIDLEHIRWVMESVRQ